MESIDPIIPVYLSSHEVAQLAGVSASTVLSWIDRGLLPAHRTPGGHRRVARDQLARFLRDNKMPMLRDLDRTLRLMMIDDDPAFLRSTRRLIEHGLPGVQVETAEGAVDGLLKVGIWRPDVVLLDAFMPGMDGPEVCRRLRSSPETGHIVVVALTGQPSPAVTTAFLDAGAVAMLTKPLDVEALRPALGLDAPLAKEGRR
jgi:excisionase family DNA binding protein